MNRTSKVLAVVAVGAIALAVASFIYAAFSHDASTGTFSTAAESADIALTQYNCDALPCTLASGDWLEKEFTHTSGNGGATERPRGALLVENLTTTKAVDYIMSTVLNSDTGLASKLYVDIAAGAAITTPDDCTVANIDANKINSPAPLLSALPSLPTRSLAASGAEVLCFRVTYDPTSTGGHVFDASASATFTFSGDESP